MATRLGLLGFGTVGAGVWDMILRQGYADSLTIGSIGVRDTSKRRTAPAELFTTDLARVVEDCDVVVEVMGGLDPAFDLLAQASRAGKPIVTANKELMAKRGHELFAMGAAPIRFEAAVGGAIPVVGTVARSIEPHQIQRIFGVLNGTSNYILNQMRELGISFGEALAEAQALGYAEADPTHDVDGYDSLFKIAILSALVTGKRPNLDAATRQGIREVSSQNIADAEAVGGRWRLVASARFAGTAVSLEVRPKLVGPAHPLFELPGGTNSVMIRGTHSGDVSLRGPGAGAGPTASAVLGDILEIVRDPHQLRRQWSVNHAPAVPEGPGPSDELGAHFASDVLWED